MASNFAWHVEQVARQFDGMADELGQHPSARNDETLQDMMRRMRSTSEHLRSAYARYQSEGESDSEEEVKPKSKRVSAAAREAQREEAEDVRERDEVRREHREDRREGHNQAEAERRAGPPAHQNQPVHRPGQQYEPHPVHRDHNRRDD